MKKESQGNYDLAKLGDLIDGIKVATLTTHAVDGSLVSHPLPTLEYSDGGELVFFTGADSQKIDDLRKKADVNVSYANPSKQSYVSVRGEASLDRDQATIDELWSPAFNVYFREGKDDPNIAVLRIRVRDAMYWDSSDNFIGQAIDFAKAAMTHDPSKMGEHGKLSAD